MNDVCNLFLFNDTFHTFVEIFFHDGLFVNYTKPSSWQEQNISQKQKERVKISKITKCVSEMF